jgi:hypothetical protein
LSISRLPIINDPHRAVRHHGARHAVGARAADILDLVIGFLRSPDKGVKGGSAPRATSDAAVTAAAQATRSSVLTLKGSDVH